MSETTAERDARYRTEMERAIAKAIREECFRRINKLTVEIEAGKARILIWEARIREHQS